MPHRSPNATSTNGLRILWLRQQYHFGPHKIAMYVNRYCEYTAIDDCTRLRVLRAYPTQDQQSPRRQHPYERLKQKTQDPLS